MPRYHLDTDDGRTPITDEDGYVLPDARSARDLALRALSDMLRGDPSAAVSREFTARVRAEDGTTLYSAALALREEWVASPAM